MCLTITIKGSEAFIKSLDRSHRCSTKRGYITLNKDLRKSPRYRIADKDILCYKFLVHNERKGTYYSPYRLEPYKLGKPMKSDLPIRADEFSSMTNDLFDVYILHGLHAYQEFYRVSAYKKLEQMVSMIESHPNIAGESIQHYCDNYDGCYLEIHKAIIPKGSVYVNGNKGDVVAEKMIINPKSYFRQRISINR